jgi:hypothetical protein
VLGRVVVVTVGVDGVSYTFGDLVGCLVDTVTDRVILALVVVISHITLVRLGGVDSGTSSSSYSNRCLGAAVNLSLVGIGVLGSDGLLGIAGGALVVWVGGVGLVDDDGTGPFAELTFSNVDLGRCVVGGRAVDCIEVTVVDFVFNLDVCVGVRGGWGLVAKEGRRSAWVGKRR